ncbi:MAG: lysis system i-spanin subunit Rz [Arsenophonus endosymbiont of Dermacentor nuttalli]
MIVGRKKLDKQTKFKNSYLKEVKLLHQIVIKRTQQLEHTKIGIGKLIDDLHNGTKRLFVKVVCAKADSITTSGLDGSRSIPLALNAERNYLHLRRQLEISEA